MVCVCVHGVCVCMVCVCVHGVCVCVHGVCVCMVCVCAWCVCVCAWCVCVCACDAKHSVSLATTGHQPAVQSCDCVSVGGGVLLAAVYFLTSSWVSSTTYANTHTDSSLSVSNISTSPVTCLNEGASEHCIDSCQRMKGLMK